MQQTDWTPYITTMSWYVPTYLLILVGIVLAIINLGRHTIPAMLALLAFGLQLVNQMITAGTMAWHMQVIPHEPGNRDDPVFAILRVVQTCLAILSQLLILAAIFGWRDSTSARTVAPTQPPPKPNP